MRHPLPISVQPLYTAEEAYNVGQYCVGIHELVPIMNTILEIHPDYPELTLAATAYAAGLLQGKREERLNTYTRRQDHE